MASCKRSAARAASADAVLRPRSSSALRRRLRRSGFPSSKAACSASAQRKTRAYTAVSPAITPIRAGRLFPPRPVSSAMPRSNATRPGASTSSTGKSGRLRGRNAPAACRSARESSPNTPSRFPLLTSCRHRRMTMTSASAPNAYSSAVSAHTAASGRPESQSPAPCAVTNPASARDAAHVSPCCVSGVSRRSRRRYNTSNKRSVGSPPAISRPARTRIRPISLIPLFSMSIVVLPAPAFRSIISNPRRRKHFLGDKFLSGSFRRAQKRTYVL